MLFHKSFLCFQYIVLLSAMIDFRFSCRRCNETSILINIGSISDVGFRISFSFSFNLIHFIEVYT